jgi:hypothetical protein
MSDAAPPPLPQEMPVGPKLPQNVPILSADAIMDVSIGAWTSKLILGLETSPQQFQPAAVVIVPTAPLVFAAAQILRNVATGPNREFFAKVYGEFQQQLAELDRGNAALAAAAQAGKPPAA